MRLRYNGDSVRVTVQRMQLCQPPTLGRTALTAARGACFHVHGWFEIADDGRRASAAKRRATGAGTRTPVGAGGGEEGDGEGRAHRYRCRCQALRWCGVEEADEVGELTDDIGVSWSGSALPTSGAAGVVG